MTRYTTTTRLHSLLLTFFGDESLSFHSRRLHTFFTAAFAEPDDDTNEDQTPSIPNLLHTQNDLLRLLDRRARGVEPGDDVPSRLRLDLLAADPWPWMRATIAKLAVVLILAVLVAGLFSGGLAVMGALGVGR